MELEVSTLRRLAFIKFIYNLGLQQSLAGEPLCCATILTFHDSIELFLQLSSEYLDKGKPQPNFMDYWDFIPEKLGCELPQKESMRRLNKSRVALKHHGTLPSKFDIESFRASTSSFFEETTHLIFNVNFDSISLIDYIEPESARIKLKEAEVLLAKSELIESSTCVALAFEYMLSEYETKKMGPFGQSPFFFGKSFTFLNKFNMGIGNDSPVERKLGEFVDNVKETLEAMQSAIKILALGLDYKKYTKFKMHTPSIIWTLNGTYFAHSQRVQDSKTKPEDIKFCIDYVIEAGINLQNFDYETEYKRPSYIKSKYGTAD